MSNKLKRIAILLLTLIISLHLVGMSVFAEEAADEIIADDILNEDGTLKTDTDVVEDLEAQEDSEIDEEETEDTETYIPESPSDIEEIPQIQAQYTDTENKKIHLLSSLEISVTLQEPDSLVTRGEYASYISSLLNSELSSDKLTYFYDVSTESSYCSVINTVYTLGLMNGTHERMFYPENFISYNDAVVVLVRALGYEVMAKNNGGYPGGYLYAATRLKLHGAGQSADGMLTRRALINLFYEALFCCVLEGEGYTNDSVTYVTDNTTLMEQAFGYKEFRGRVVADGFASIGGRSVCDKSDIVINHNGNDYVYSSDGITTGDFLGKSIYYYANADGEIICLRETGSDKELVIDAYDVESSDAYVRKITWYDKETGRSGNESIDTMADFIYNGRNDTLSKYDVENANGSIRLLDTDGDSAYDCVFVTNYQYYLSDGITSDGILRDKRPGTSFDFHSDDSKYHTTVIKYGIETDISMINPYEIVAIAKSRNTEGDKKIVAYVYDDVLEGSVTALGDNEISVEGKEYSYMKGFSADTVYLNDRAMFGLDANGRICLYKKIYNNSRTYLYVTGFGIKSSIGTKCTVRGMNDSGDFVEYDFADSFKVNGSKGDADDVKSNLGGGTVNPQLTAIKLDDNGKIKEIQFDSTAEGPRADGSRDIFTYNKSFTDGRFESSHGIIAAEYWLLDSTRIFTIYTDARGEIIEEASSEATKQYKAIASRVKVPIDVFDATESDRVAGAVVFNLDIAGMNTYYSHDPQAFVVDKMFYKLNENGDYTLAASGYQSGSARTLIAEEGVYDMSAWKKGDVYRITKGINGNVIKGVRLFGLNEDAEDTTAMFYDRVYTEAAISAEKVNSTSILMLGNLRNVDNDTVPAVYIEVEGTGDVYTYKLQTTSRIYKYDTESESYSVITAQDLAGGIHKAFVFARYGIVRDLVIID